MKEEILTFPKDYCLVEIDEKQNLEHKFEGADGKPIYREDNKILKGVNYFKPDLEQFIK